MHLLALSHFFYLCVVYLLPTYLPTYMSVCLLVRIRLFIATPCTVVDEFILIDHLQPSINASLYPQCLLPR
jgi:hypothetical protein